MFRSNLRDNEDFEDMMNFANSSEDEKKPVKNLSTVNSTREQTSTTTKDDSGSDSESGFESDSGASSLSSESDKSDSVILPPTRKSPTNSSTKPTIFAPASPQHCSSLKRKHSDSTSSSSSNSDNESESYSDDSTISRGVKRLKTNPSTKSKSSTVASRNPFPPEFLYGTIKPRPTSIQLEGRSTTPDEIKAAAEVTKYPTDVLTAARSLEVMLPPYLTSATLSHTEKRLDHEALRPPAGSDDSARLVKVLESARKLIVHLSVKKINESETDMQTQMVRIAKEREQLLKIMEREVTRLLVKQGGK